MSHDILDPKDMPSFLNSIAKYMPDFETRMKVVMCSMFIHIVLAECLGGNKNECNKGKL